MTVEIRPRSSWTTTPFAWPRYSSRLFDKSVVTYLTFHYPAIPRTIGVIPESEEEGWLRTVRSWHVDGNGWADIGYAMVIFQSSRIYMAGGITHSTAHAGKDNPVAVGVLFMVGNDEKPSEAALRSANAIGPWLREHQGFHAIETIIDHGRLPGQSTSCAGVHVRAAIDAGEISLGESMPIAENGWSTVSLSSTATFLAPNGKIVYCRNTDVATILGYVAWRWHFSVESLVAATNLVGDPAVRQGLVVIHAWRPAARIAGTSYYSNHGTGMAMDVMGHLHPYEYTAPKPYRDGFTNAQRAALRKIQSEVRALAGGSNILRLGIDFSVGRRDGMHVELWGTASKFAAAARNIRNSGWIVPWRKGDIAAYQALVGADADDFHGAGTTTAMTLTQRRLRQDETGRWDKATQTAVVQEWLVKAGYDPGPVDGIPGDRYNSALGKFQSDQGLVADLIPGQNTLRALLEAAKAPKPAPVPKPKPEPEPEPAPNRLAGPNRYGTAAQVAIDSGLKKVYLAVGNGPTLADAVSAAARGDGAVLYVRENTTTLPSETRNALAKIRPTEIVPVGSVGVVPDALVAEAYKISGLKPW